MSQSNTKPTRHPASKAAERVAKPATVQATAKPIAEPTPGLLDYHPPSVSTMRTMFSVPRSYFNPEFLGLWELDLDRPALFVGNHTLLGMTDAPLMIEHIYSQYGVMVRALGDRGHFKVPVWGDMLTRVGVVEGSPANCAALMENGHHVLVFPGGGREVMRRRGEAYNLIWKQRTGFARLAIEHGYDIIPFGSVGPDESFTIMADANDLKGSGLWNWLDRKFGLDAATRGGDMVPPIVRGIGPTLIPRPQRYYFGFGKRIPTEHLRGRAQDKEALWEVREAVAESVEDQINRLLRYRYEDRKQNWGRVRRWLAPLDAPHPAVNMTRQRRMTK